MAHFLVSFALTRYLERAWYMAMVDVGHVAYNGCMMGLRHIMGTYIANGGFGACGVRFDCILSKWCLVLLNFDDYGWLLKIMGAPFSSFCVVRFVSLFTHFYLDLLPLQVSSSLQAETNQSQNGT